jgi:SMODS and SLOG-associating 2TM effector domain 3/SMODS and SLOG-associating 2TM effector domain 1
MNKEDFPALYVTADEASKSAQKMFFCALGSILILLVVGACLSVLNYSHHFFALLQSLVLLLSLFLTIYLAYENPQKSWYATRAIAESMKTLTWRFMMQAEPFNSTDEKAKLLFVESARKMLTANRQAMGKSVEMTHSGQITQAMNLNRNNELELRKQFYLSKRIDDQLGWYKRNAISNRKLSVIWLVVLVSANVFAVLFSVLRVSFSTADYWPTDVFIALAASTLSWLQSNRFQELAASYSLTAQDISLLKELIPTSGGKNKFSVFVADAENAFSREHTQWQARRDDS